LIGCASFAGQFAYISDSPFVLIAGYGVAPARYGLYFGSTALALMLGSMLGARLLGRHSTRRMLAIGASAICTGGLLVAAGAQARWLGVNAFMAPMLLYFAGLGLTGPSATALAMEPVPELAGTASAAIGFLTMLSGALAGYLTTRIGGQEPALLGGIVALMGMIVASLVASAAFARRRSQREPNARGGHPLPP
jgi:DHA1 family bicyclomycin/chloramphenicol resistance-like MFS transporter